MINWATDQKFKGMFAGQAGLVIGRGQQEEYVRNKGLDKFSGIKIGCNSAYKVTDVDVLIWMDPKFFESHWREIVLVDCLKLAINPIHYDHHGVNIIGLEAEQPDRCSESFESGFYPCNLSGYIALNLAMLFGLNPVYIYGFNPDTEILKEKSKSFKFIADWADNHNRQIYITDKNSYLERYFEYKALPAKALSGVSG